MYYLEMEYGLQKFTDIYQKIKALKLDQQGDLLLDEYQETLETLFEPQEVAVRLPLFLALIRLEEQASESIPSN